MRKVCIIFFKNFVLRSYILINIVCFCRLCVVEDDDRSEESSHIESLLKTSAFLKTNSDEFLEIDLSEKINSFSPVLLVYLTDISHLDFSGCRSIDGDLMADCLVFCQGLQKLEMANCRQFSEKHFSIMLPKLQSLKYADFASCAEISFTGAFWIISEMPNLLCINFDPLNATSDVFDWEVLLRHFTLVNFGHNVRCQMPFYANYWRISQQEEDVIGNEE